MWEISRSSSRPRRACAADILWSIIVIAERCNVDLACSFAATMDEIEAALTAQP